MTQVDYMTNEQFIISQSPQQIEKLNKIISARIKIIKNFENWNSKEKYFWEWIQINFDPDLFINSSSDSISGSDSSLGYELHPEAKEQLKRYELS